jgi:plastocyanin
MENPVDPATAGSISGAVTFTGTPAAGEAIDMSAEPVCLDKHASQPMTQPAVVGSGGGLANVFVYVKSGLEGIQFPVASEEVVLDQDGCEYHPHVLGVMAGQEIMVRNSDAVLHNIKATPTENRGFNRSQPQAGMEFETSFTVPEVMIPVECDVHNWMRAYVGVTGHPFHAVTDEGGAFSLEGLPPGEYEIEAWHETYGVSSQMVTVPASGQVEASFEFSESMAGRHVPLGAPAYVDHEVGRIVRGTAAAVQLED